MYLLRWLRAGLLLVAALGCLLGCHGATAQQATDNRLKEVQLGKDAFTLGDQLPAWVEQLPIPELAKTASLPVVVRLADSQYLLGKVPALHVRRVTQINDAAALTAAGRLSIAFAPEYEHVQLHAIRIYRGQEQFDRTQTSNIRFLQREQDLERGVYSGRVTASILIDDLRVGDTIEIAYTSSGQNPVFGGKAFGLSPWDQGAPTLRRRVVLNYPTDRSIAWRVVGDRALPPLLPTETVRDGMRRVSFDQQPLPGFPGETMAPPDYFGLRFVQFSEFANWSDVSAWASNLFAATAPQDGEFRDVVKRIKALPSEPARAMAALEFVQSQIRHFSVALGENSHRPTLPDEVLRRRYGDCKDKSLLLVTLLRELGIKSQPVLLQIGRHGGLEKTLPSPQFFDHAIVEAMVGGKPYFLDPTRLGQHGELDRAGQAHGGVQVLVVARETDSVSRIPADTGDIVGDEITERATLAKFGAEGQLDVRRVWRGLGAEQLRVVLERATHEQVTRFVRDALERRYPGATLVGEPAVQNDIVKNELSISAHYRIPKLATEAEGSWVVGYALDNMQNVLIASQSANRTTPLRIPGFPFHGKYSFEMSFPEQVSISIDPREHTVSNKYFNATVTEYFRGSNARKTVELKTLQPSVEPADYSGYAEDLRSLNKAIGNAFAVNKAMFNNDAAKADITHRLQQQHEETIKKTTEIIDGGKLSGSDLANGYCLRGHAKADLDRVDEALQDVNTAVRLAPAAANMLTCRASVYFRAGQFDKSVTDYSNAIALGGGADGIGISFRWRGVAQVYAGRMQEAIEDFAKASELGDREARIYSDMWLIATYGRLGKPVPDDMVKRAGAEAQGEWPRAGLAMLAGLMSPDELLKSLEKKAGDERQMALAEAYFYIGLRNLALGDIRQAQASFQKTRDIGVINYIENDCAAFELDRLKKLGATTSAKPAAGGAAAH
ncbi:DUF3857 domain-containing protein [Bradyrhizobium mercantei]|uniref:DUF3857 domain-containing protein n=1 Tax=Bradyrhizobium mercantei TaxID=1904807 RepID=UPI0009764EDB|nr:DUF3857 domain-containing protein [Bradyrhizobium mercantei]